MLRWPGLGQGAGREWVVLATPRQGGLCRGGWGSPQPGRGTKGACWISLCSKTVGRFSLEIFWGQMEPLPGRRFPQDGLDAHKHEIVHGQCIASSRQGQILVPYLRLEAGLVEKR